MNTAPPSLPAMQRPVETTTTSRQVKRTTNDELVTDTSLALVPVSQGLESKEELLPATVTTKQPIKVDVSVKVVPKPKTKKSRFSRD